jgi:hypothetical protein
VRERHVVSATGTAWCDKAEQRMRLLVDMLDQWAGLDAGFGQPDPERNPAFLATNPPKPKSVLRVTPDA